MMSYLILILSYFLQNSLKVIVNFSYNYIFIYFFPIKSVFMPYIIDSFTILIGVENGDITDIMSCQVISLCNTF